MFRSDFSSYELPADVYTDGIGQVDNLGVNFRSVFFVFRRGAGGVLMQVPVLCLVRPRSSLTDGGVRRELLAQEDPNRRNRQTEHILHS